MQLRLETKDAGQLTVTVENSAEYACSVFCLYAFGFYRNLS